MRRLGAAWLVPAIFCVALGVGCTDPVDQVNSSDAATRKAGINKLSERDTDEAAQALATVATHDDPLTAREAVRGLSRMNTPAAVKALVQVAQTEKRPELRIEAAIGLEHQSAPEAAQTLRTMVQSEPDPVVRGQAAAGLARAGAYRDALLLLAQAEKEQDVAAQVREVRAFEQLVGLRFGFDPKAPPEKRRLAIENMKRMAPTLVKRLEGSSPVKKGPDSAAK